MPVRVNPRAFRRLYAGTLCLLREWRSFHKRQAPRFSVESANFDFVENQRRRYDCAGNAALCGSNCAESGSRKSARRILHVRENSFVIAVSWDMAQGTELQPFDMAATLHFFVAVGNISAIHHERNALAAGDSSRNGANKFTEILLANRGDRWIVHAFDFQAPLVAVVMAGF